MYRYSIITLLVIWFHGELAFSLPQAAFACFRTKTPDGWCRSELILCGSTSAAYDISVNITHFNSANEIAAECTQQCHNVSVYGSLNLIEEAVVSVCTGKNNCSLASFSVSPIKNHGGILNITYVCMDKDDDKGADNSTPTDGGNKPFPTSSSVIRTSKPTTMNINTLTEDSESSIGNNITTARVSTVKTTTHAPQSTATLTSVSIIAVPTAVLSTSSPGGVDISILTNTEPTSSLNGVTIAQIGKDSPTTAIVVSVVISAIIAVVVVAVMMYRRGKCKLRFVKCMKMYDKHTDTADAYAMSSRANVNRTYDLSRGVDVIVCDVDYCEIDKVGKETDVEYSHVNLEKKQAVQDPTYNHIEHFNISSGNAEQTYNHVGDETLRITESSTLQPDTYSHIGAMAKPASEQLTDYSYAHINGVMKYTPEANDINPYDCAVLETNCGPTGIFGHQACKMKSGKEKKFYVVGPSKVDVNNEDPVSHSYFILEKHEKKA